MRLSGRPDETAGRTAIAILGVTQAESARQQLIANGVTKEQVEAMPALQAVLLSTAQELRQIGDDLGKAHLLPTVPSRQLAIVKEKEFQDLVRQNRATSFAGAISGLLYPAVRQAAEAEVRMQMLYDWSR